MEDLRKWVKEKWVDIGAPKKGGGYKPCGRSEGEKRKGYPKCVPSAKASSMSKKQKKSAVKRKRAAGNSGGKPTMVSTLKKTNKKSESMTRFKEALNELKGKHAAKRARSYQDQHRGTRPVRGTPDQEAAARKATGGKYNDTVVAASQGKVKKPGGEAVTADYAAKTFRKAGKHAVAQARKNESLEKFKTVILEKLCAKGKAAAKRKYDVYPSAYANMYGSAVCSGKVKPGGKKKNESQKPRYQMTPAEQIQADKEEAARNLEKSKNANLAHRAARQARGEVGPQTGTGRAQEKPNEG